MDRLQILRRHNVRVRHLQLHPLTIIVDAIATATDLCTAAPISTRSLVVQAQIALARDRHAERTVGKHLDLHQPTRRPDDPLLSYLASDLRHLI